MQYSTLLLRSPSGYIFLPRVVAIKSVNMFKFKYSTISVNNGFSNDRQWKLAEVTLAGTIRGYLYFEGYKGGTTSSSVNNLGDIGLDDVTVTRGACLVKLLAIY